MKEDNQWRPIETAPKDGRIFEARNADHPNRGSFPMLRNIKHIFRDGQFTTKDMGGWIKVLDNEPGHIDIADTPTPPRVPFSLAPDQCNQNIRYEWRDTFSPAQQDRSLS